MIIVTISDSSSVGDLPSDFEVSDFFIQIANLKWKFSIQIID